MQYTVIYNKTTDRWEPHERAKEGDEWKQCTINWPAPRLPLAFASKDLALSWVEQVSMPTLTEDRDTFEYADVPTLRKIWDGLWSVPVEIALGGEHMGYETIQERYLCWRKGTPRVTIEQEIMHHANWSQIKI